MHIFIFEVAKFQALIPSLMKVFFESSEKLWTGSISFDIDLIDLTFGPISLLTRLKGWSSSFTAFHISDSFIWALIWLTDNILNFASIDAVLILSLILVPFRRRSILFWCNWRSFMISWLVPWRIYAKSKQGLYFLLNILFFSTSQTFLIELSFVFRTHSITFVQHYLKDILRSL